MKENSDTQYEAYVHPNDVHKHIYMQQSTFTISYVTLSNDWKCQIRVKFNDFNRCTFDIFIAVNAIPKTPETTAGSENVTSA